MFGNVFLNAHMKITKLIEKPKSNHWGNYVLSGVFILPESFFDILKKCQGSMEKALEKMVETLKASINEEAMAVFMKKGTAESFVGTDGMTTASIQLRKRSGRSKLSEQERLVLDELGIDTTKSDDSRFYINNKYSEDTALLGKVSEALDGIVPDDFLGHTGDKYVTTADSIRQAFEKTDESNREQVLGIVGTQAARTKFGGTHDEMVAILDKILKG